MSDLELILVDPNPVLCRAFRTHFETLPRVQVVQGYFDHLPVYDCMVSAANSFGLMDGGVDAAIIRYFGVQLMERVQQIIVTEYLGEQPVGASFIVETEHPAHPFLAHTPTMRVPMVITRTDNVYRAMWAMLLAVRRHNRDSPERPIRTIACPGLGTGTGGVPADEAARQMAAAYLNFWSPPRKIDWLYANDRQTQVGYGGNPDR